MNFQANNWGEHSFLIIEVEEGNVNVSNTYFGKNIYYKHILIESLIKLLYYIYNMSTQVEAPSAEKLLISKNRAIEILTSLYEEARRRAEKSTYGQDALRQEENRLHQLLLKVESGKIIGETVLPPKGTQYMPVDLRYQRDYGECVIAESRERGVKVSIPALELAKSNGYMGKVVVSGNESPFYFNRKDYLGGSSQTLKGFAAALVSSEGDQNEILIADIDGNSADQYGRTGAVTGVQLAGLSNSKISIFKIED